MGFRQVTENEHRQLSRDSLFLMAELRFAGADATHRIKVRNLSAGGMMAEGPVKTIRGTRVEVEIRNIGWVSGSIAWVQGDRCGIAFDEDIDPLVARAPVVAGETTPRFCKPVLAATGESRLRKI